MVNSFQKFKKWRANRKLILIIFITIVILAGFWFNEEIFAAYSSSGNMISTNLLDGVGTVNTIDSFFASTTLPSASTTLWAQFATTTSGILMATTSVSRQVNANSDDAEQDSGVMYLLGNTIALLAADDFGGFRWTGVNIPDNATATTAYIEIYLPDKNDDYFDDKIVYCQNAKNPVTFSGNNNISDRATTTNSIELGTGGKGIGWETSPSIVDLIQEVIDDQSGTGDALVIIIDNASAIDLDIRSYDSDTELAAKLYIEYQYDVPDIDWYSAAGALDGTTTIADGTSSTDLSGLSWSGANFYYKMYFNTTDTNNTPALEEIGVEYNFVGETLTVASPTLDGGTAITLTTGGGTTTVIGTTTITDTDGYENILFATATLYRNGAATSCTSGAANPNWCYYMASTSCSFGATTSSTTDTACSADVWFVAEPTAGTSSLSGEWQMDITATCACASTSTGTTSQDLNSFYYLDITGSIDYGELIVGATSSDATTTVTNQGNVPIDIEILGVDMESGAYSIAIGQQKYSDASLGDWVGTAASTTPQSLNLSLPKPTSTTSPDNDDIYWMLKIPNQQKGSYTGTNTIGTIDEIPPWTLNEANCNALSGWKWIDANDGGSCWSKTLADSVSWNKGVGNDNRVTGSYTCTSLGTYDLQTRMTAAAAGEWYKVVSNIDGTAITSSHNGSSGYSVISALAISDCIDGTKDLSDCGGPCTDWSTTNTWLRNWAGASGKSALPRLTTDTGDTQGTNDYDDACVDLGAGNDVHCTGGNDFYLNRKVCDDGDDNTSWAAACGASDGTPWETYARRLGSNNCSSQGYFLTSSTSNNFSFRVVVRP